MQEQIYLQKGVISQRDKYSSPQIKQAIKKKLIAVIKNFLKSRVTYGAKIMLMMLADFGVGGYELLKKRFK